MSRRPPAPEPHDGDLDPPGTVRLDKWLWAARFFKTRGLAAEAIDGGKVDVNGDRAKRSRHLQVGDVVRVRHGADEWHVVVRDVSSRRGPATVARELYEETHASLVQRERLREMRQAMPVAFAYGEGKPGKRDRRALRRLKGDD